MITFKQYLSEKYAKSRLEKVESESAAVWLEHYAPKFIKGDTRIYRGVDAGEGIFIGDASKSDQPRVSSNTANFYTLWMDNHPSFKDLPKRSKSFICTTSEGYASGYGEVYYVIPADNAKVGVVGTQDIWNTHLNNDYRLLELNEQTEELFDDEGIRVETWDDLQKALKSIDADMFQSEIRGTKTMYDVWEKLVTPKHFKFMTGSDLSKINNSNTELWIEGECLFIPVSYPPDDAATLLHTIQDLNPAFAKEIELEWENNTSDNKNREAHIDVDRLSSRDTLTHTQKQRSK